MLGVLFLIGFFNQKTVFLDNHHFLCLLYNWKGCLFRCVTFNFYRVGHTLIVRVRRGTDIYCLILYDIGIFHVLLDVQSLEKLENLTIFDLCLYCG